MLIQWVAFKLKCQAHSACLAIVIAQSDHRVWERGALFYMELAQVAPRAQLVCPPALRAIIAVGHHVPSSQSCMRTPASLGTALCLKQPSHAQRAEHWLAARDALITPAKHPVSVANAAPNVTRLPVELAPAGDSLNISRIERLSD